HRGGLVGTYGGGLDWSPVPPTLCRTVCRALRRALTPIAARIASAVSSAHPTPFSPSGLSTPLPRHWSIGRAALPRPSCQWPPPIFRRLPHRGSRLRDGCAPYFPVAPPFPICLTCLICTIPASTPRPAT